MGRRTAIWFRLKGRKYRAKAANGSVNLSDANAEAARKSIAAHGGKVVEVRDVTNPDQQALAELIDLMDWSTAAQVDWHYSMALTGAHRRNMAIGLPPRSLPVWADCSAGCILLYRWGGFEDPTGNGFTGHGNTDTLVSEAKRDGRLVGRAHLRPGDMIVYGNEGATLHVVMVRAVLDHGRDFVVWSHGQEKGPLQILESSEHAAHGYARRWFIRRPEVAAA